MSIVNRLTGTELPKLPVHQFWASMVQYANGRITEVQLKAQCEILSAEDIAEWNWLKGKYQASTNKPNFLQSMHILFMLSEYSWYGYNSNPALVAEINALP